MQRELLVHIQHREHARKRLDLCQKNEEGEKGEKKEEVSLTRHISRLMRASIQFGPARRNVYAAEKVIAWKRCPRTTLSAIAMTSPQKRQQAMEIR